MKCDICGREVDYVEWIPKKGTVEKRKVCRGCRDKYILKKRNQFKKLSRFDFYSTLCGIIIEIIIILFIFFIVIGSI